MKTVNFWLAIAAIWFVGVNSSYVVVEGPSGEEVASGVCWFDNPHECVERIAYPLPANLVWDIKADYLI